MPTYTYNICMPSSNILHMLSGSSRVLKPIHGFFINNSSSTYRFKARTEYQVFQRWLSEDGGGKGYFSNVVTLKSQANFLSKKAKVFLFAVLTSANSLNIGQPRNISQPNAIKITPGLGCVHLAEFPFHTIVGLSVLAHFFLSFSYFFK